MSTGERAPRCSYRAPNWQRAYAFGIAALIGAMTLGVVETEGGWGALFLVGLTMWLWLSLLFRTPFAIRAEGEAVVFRCVPRTSRVPIAKLRWIHESRST